ncbi:hypothetical protein GALL_227330 [mine drainage metagenome]|uniref:Uncharacterized protein n=1 Tax=mine drainage metagenome TaxID=410659 RepID=A0A1J5RTF5_9ZZZZ
MPDNQPLSKQEMQRKGRKVFILMLIFFAVPIVVVIMMYRFNWIPTGASIGELVTPVRLLSSPLDIQDNEAKVLTPLFWKEKWSIVFVADECGQACFEKLHDMRQLHVSLYKDMDRAQRVLITKMQDVSKIKSDYPGMAIINQPAVSVTNLIQQFQVNSENVTLSNRIYLVDPLGHLMMSYPSDVPLADVRKDVTRLLRYSWAG